MKPTRAGSSAAGENRKRQRAVSRSQRWLAFSCLLAVVVLCGVIFNWLYALAAVGAVYLAATFATLVGDLRRKPGRSDSWQRGALGEQLTERVLAKLGRRNFTVIHDVALGATQANIDHLVIGPTGVFVLDSKNWRGKASQNDHGVWVYGKPLVDTLRSTIAERDWVVQFLEPELSAWNVPVYAAWVMTGARQPFTAIDELHVVHLDDLTSFIGNRRPELSRSQLRKLSSRARMLRPA